MVDVEPAVHERSMTRNPHLDAIRGVAISGVLMWHFLVPVLSEHPGSVASYLGKTMSLGWAGVDLFFVLSGYLIGSIILRYKGSDNFRLVFLTRRFCRIVPAYALLLVVNTFVDPKVPLAGHVPFWSYICFVQNIFMAVHSTFGVRTLSVTWSLAIEEQFYLLGAILLPVFSTGRIRQIAVTVFFFTFILRISILGLVSPLAIYVLLPTRADSLAAGLVLATFIPMYGPQSEWFRTKGRKFLNLAGCTAVLAILPMMFRGRGFGTPYVAIIGYSALAIVAATLVSAAASGALALAKLPNWLMGPLRFLGERAYSIYLFHPPISALIERSPVRHIRILAFSGLISTCASVVAAHCIFHIVERPVMDFGRRFRYATVGELA